MGINGHWPNVTPSVCYFSAGHASDFDYDRSDFCFACPRVARCTANETGSASAYAVKFVYANTHPSNRKAV